MKKDFSARIHVVFASEKPYAVVFRRGPSKEVCTFLWNRKNDTFELGQWLKGRIYERRSDLSPDGKYLIYFAMNGKWNSETKGSWTAVSKAPWLKAIELYSKGDCWEGGGLFLSKNSYWLNDSYFSTEFIMEQSSQVHRKKNFIPDENFGAECTGVYYRRLIRDGWDIINTGGVNLDSYTIFEKKLPKDWVIRKVAHEQVGSPEGKGCYWDEHVLVNGTTDTKIECHDWEWAEIDRNEIVYASFGKIYRVQIHNKKELGSPILLYNFNDMAFEEIEAPY